MSWLLISHWTNIALTQLIPGVSFPHLSSDGETVSEPEQDEDEVEHEAEKGATVVEREEPDVEMAEPAPAEEENGDQALADESSFFHPHLALEGDHDEDADAEDEPDPLDLLSEPRILQFSDDQLGSAFRGEMGAPVDDQFGSASRGGMDALDALAEAASQSQSADDPSFPPPDLARLGDLSVTYSDAEHLAVTQLLLQSGYPGGHDEPLPPQADPTGQDDRHHSRTPSSTAVLTPDAFANGFDLLYDDDEHDGEDGESEEETFDPTSASRSHSIEDDASAMTLEPWDFGGPPISNGDAFIGIIDDDPLEYGSRGI